jgi:hypothetical protein
MTDILRPHKTLERNGITALQLTTGPFSGIIFSYGGVSFEENKEKDHLKVHFDYEIHDGEPENFDKAAFEKELGDFIIELTIYGLQQQSLVYKGGVDENREVNPIELDSQ